MTWAKFFSDPAMMGILVIAVLVAVVLYQWQTKSDKFDLRQMLVDSSTEKISVEKVGMVTALIVSSWGFINMIQDGKMTEWYFLGYISAWGLARVASQGISILKGKETK